MAAPAPKSSLADLFAIFLKLGCICFGGPIAHLGYFHEEFVRRRQWLDEEHFTDLVALCNFLPGPASSQTVFAIGLQRAGVAGALVASAAFLLPSTILLILFAYGVSALGDPATSGWLHGLKIAATAVVAQAVVNMMRRLTPDVPRLALALAVTTLVTLRPGAYSQITALAAGLVLGWVLFRPEGTKPGARSMESKSFSPTKEEISDEPEVSKLETRNSKLETHSARKSALAALALYFILLLLLPEIAHGQILTVFARFYRAGALVFGGGHVILPLLRAEVVPPGWVGNNAFLAGYGATQAVPGPIFSFAAYLGTLIFHGGWWGWLGGLLCLLAIYLPGWLVVGGALPFWQTLRHQVWAQGMLRGANAAVVGLLLAALAYPIIPESIDNWLDAVAALGAWLALERFRAPPWLIVILAAALGRWI